MGSSVRTAGSLLELVGNTPLVELPRLSPKSSVRLYAKLEGQNPTGSIKDRVALSMIETAEAAGELEPGRELLEPTSGNTGIALALVAKLKGYPLTCVLPENATEERRQLLRIYGATIVESPGAEGSNGAVRLALELAEREPRYFMPFQYANEANPRAHFEGTGAEIAEALDRVDVLVAGLGTGGTLMGVGARLRESFPDVVVAAAEPLPGDPVMGLRSLDDGYVPPILDVAEARSEAARLERGRRRGRARASRPRRRLRRRLERCRPPHRPPARGRARRGSRGLRPRRRRLEVPLRGLLAGRGDRREQAVVVVPPAVREALADHARQELPNESCGLLVLRDGVADRYEPGRNGAESPYRFELEVAPELWFLEDDGYELAVVHSHVSAPPRPSRTDVENVGLWQGRPYLIYSVARDELAAWTIAGGAIEPLELS